MAVQWNGAPRLSGGLARRSVGAMQHVRDQRGKLNSLSPWSLN